jgi:hypothetical protein
MSRLMADHESRGRKSGGDPGTGEEDSVMRVNLSEGYEAVNDETRRMLKNSASVSSARRARLAGQARRPRPDSECLAFPASLACLVRLS